MRFATASPSGKPDVAPVGFTVDGDDIITAGFDITKTVRYRNVQSNPRASVVIDDLASIDPWSPRGVKIVGTVSIEMVNGSPQFRISPDVIISWGVNDTSPGIPKMERRSLRS
jgi:pyridoxamine 5'-phosphate oxidase family protein